MTQALDEATTELELRKLGLEMVPKAAASGGLVMLPLIDSSGKGRLATVGVTPDRVLYDPTSILGPTVILHVAAPRDTGRPSQSAWREVAAWVSRAKGRANRINKKRAAAAPLLAWGSQVEQTTPEKERVWLVQHDLERRVRRQDRFQVADGGQHRRRARDRVRRRVAVRARQARPGVGPWRWG